jgi:hypothetical protein
MLHDDSLMLRALIESQLKICVAKMSKDRTVN